MELADLDSEEDRRAVADLARRSMRASYSLSPEQIDAVIEAEFDADALATKADRDDLVLVLARQDGEPVGVAEGTDDATVRWLHVAPEARGEGVGTRLFEAMRDRVGDDGEVTARVLSENQEGAAFFERFDLEPVDDVQTEIGGQRLVERVFADPARADREPGEADGGAGTGTARGTETAGGMETAGGTGSAGATETAGRSDATEETDQRDADIPATLTVDGRERYVDRDDPESGTLGPMFPVFEDEAHDDLYGYYCGNSGTFTAEVDEQGRIRCDECGNVHRPDDWDGGYL